ncbi:MAG: 4-phosphoerythronate dehydrogenase [Gammaproteobacteria bacterium]|nr:4-phosphoerythronate dehydrogenase [Gammaproteobacteria bacterium]
MKIFADKNILAVQGSFSRYGELHLFDGRTVKQADLLEADVLLVRSITTVNESLLGGTNIRFVGTATSGVDHVDTAYLDSAGIYFADAKGSNANAVVDYCFAALAFAALHKGFELSGSTVGIVGAGAVGGLFASKLERLGVQVRCCDPFLEQASGEHRLFFSLEEVLECEAVSLHVPLSDGGLFPTRHLLAAQELAKLRNNVVLINACRGNVVDERALEEVLAHRSDIVTVFDVWADEPNINSRLAASVDIATPHIAGYSQEAKSRATSMLVAAFERYSKIDAGMDAEDKLAASVTVDIEPVSESMPLWETLLAVFPLIEISEEFLQAQLAGEGARSFDSIRQKLLSRHEFESCLLHSSNYSAEQLERLAVLGFQF